MKIRKKKNPTYLVPWWFTLIFLFNLYIGVFVLVFAALMTILQGNPLSALNFIVTLVILIHFDHLNLVRRGISMRHAVRFACATAIVERLIAILFEDVQKWACLAKGGDEHDGFSLYGFVLSLLIPASVVLFSAKFARMYLRKVSSPLIPVINFSREGRMSCAFVGSQAEVQDSILEQIMEQDGGQDRDKQPHDESDHGPGAMGTGGHGGGSVTVVVGTTDEFRVVTFSDPQSAACMQACMAPAMLLQKRTVKEQEIEQEQEIEIEKEKEKDEEEDGGGEHTNTDEKHTPQELYANGVRRVQKASGNRVVTVLLLRNSDTSVYLGVTALAWLLSTILFTFGDLIIYIAMLAPSVPHPSELSNSLQCLHMNLDEEMWSAALRDVYGYMAIGIAISVSFSAIFMVAATTHGLAGGWRAILRWLAYYAFRSRPFFLGTFTIVLSRFATEKWVAAGSYIVVFCGAALCDVMALVPHRQRYMFGVLRSMYLMVSLCMLALYVISVVETTGCNMKVRTLFELFISVWDKATGLLLFSTAVLLTTRKVRMGHIWKPMIELDRQTAVSTSSASGRQLHFTKTAPANSHVT